MADLHRHQGCHGIATFVFGVFVGSLRRTQQRQRRRPVGPNSPLRGLDARQAMIAVSFGRICGFIAMGVFAAYYAYSVSQL